MAAADLVGMDRPLRRDTFARIFALPSSITLFACLTLPQAKDCHGHVQTAHEAGTTPFIVVMALVALVPLAWQLRVLRSPLTILACVFGALAVCTNVLLIPVAIYCVFVRPWRSTEQFVAFACSCIALAFVVLFPLLSLFSSWLEGAVVAWFSAWAVLIGSSAWASAARVRALTPPRLAEMLVPEPAPPSLPAPAPEPVFEAPPPAPLPAQIGDYEIECELGAGGMARVYRGRHRHLETQHAIKVLDPSYRRLPEARQRFLDEAKIQAKLLSHPNIVKVTNIVATPEHAALVMDYIAGPSLETEIAALPGNPEEITRIMLGILAAVDHAHRAGVIHRDLKPGNVLLDGPDRIPRVTDFGIAKVTSADYVPSSTTGRHARMGTLPYMSPEQLRGPQYVTEQSDVFSLGIVLYEMTTGALPFRGESEYEVMDAIICGRYFMPRVIDARLARAIATALKPDPLRRYASCAVMAAALSGSGR